MAAKRVLPAPQNPSLSDNSSLNEPLEVLKSSPLKKVQQSPIFPQQQQTYTSEASMLLDSGEVDNLFSTFSTANGSSISFGDFQTVAHDIEDLNLFENLP